MKKNIILLILSAIFIYLAADRFGLQIIWVNPNVNTNVLQSVSKTVKKLDTAADYTIRSLNSQGCDLTVIYKNQYGSGFLKHNPIPNDLDYSIGIYLGEFTGQNSTDIAAEIDEKMTLFQTEFYSWINTLYPDIFYTDYNIMTSLSELFSKREENIAAISKSLPQLFAHKDYVVYTKKNLLNSGQKEIEMTFPFVLKKNEILMENYTPVRLYTDSLKYSENTRAFLREITIVIDFYADIKQGNDTVRAEIVAESFTGQRLQLTRRFFVPVIFTGRESARFLKHLSLLNDDETYFEYRMFNFKRHLQEISNLKELNPVKLLKRLLQCTDLILPVLDENTAQKILTVTEQNLSNSNIILINDYQTSLDNLTQICSRPDLYLKLQYKNLITAHINSMQQILFDMKQAKTFMDAEITMLETFTLDIEEKIKLINSPGKLEEFYKYLRKNSTPVEEILLSGINKNIKEKEKITDYIKHFNKIMENAGYHKIEMCWIGENLIGIVKDDFTSQIPEKELKTMAQENKLAEVEYKFINRSELSGPKVRYAVWIRYNPSEDENFRYNIIKSKLAADKKNFKIKRRIIF